MGRTRGSLLGPVANIKSDAGSFGSVRSSARDAPSEVFGLKARVLGHTRKHAWTEFLAVMESEHKVGPAFPRKSAVRASLTLQMPTDPEKSRKDAPSLGRRLTAHVAAGNEMLISCG